MKRRRLWIVLIVVAVLLAAAYLAAGWFFSTFIIASETQTLADAAAAAEADNKTPADVGLPPPEEVSIDAGEVTLAGWYFDNPADGDCGVMFLHGFHGTRYHALNWAPMFWERGCDLLAYDHRGQGASSPAFYTYGFYEKQDAVMALDWFTERTGLERPQIGVFGVSYGAATALQMAPLTPGLAFIGADSAYSDLREILSYQAESMFPVIAPIILPGALKIAELRADFDVDEVAPERAVAAAGMPIFLIHSLTDEYTFSTHSEDIYANSDLSRTVLHLTDWGSPHARDILTDYPTYRRLFGEFLAQYAPEFRLLPTTP